ncbi:MAG: phosphoribosylanthranilate isomerase [Pirellulaceae bacterium]|nr:phosphoribosylanthranilate isomerase [Pirellulaceae bacterium]
MFRIKICGITSVEDALLVAEAGADAIGLNFYGQSPRYVTAERAQEICDALPPGITKVGLFVNSPPQAVAATVNRVGLGAVQLHGDEGPDFLAALGKLPVNTAFRCKESTLDNVKAFLNLCDETSHPFAILLDAHAPGLYGGTGQVLDWKGLARERDKLMGLPLILAGGLTPENVAEAIRQVRPDAVDTASGVEASPGKKDPAQVRAFVAAAKAAGLE